MATEAVYSATTTIAATNLNSLADDAFTALPEVDNSSNNYIDALVGGVIQTGASGWAADGHFIDVYVVAMYSATATDKGGAMGSTGGIAAAGEALTESTEFKLENILPVTRIVAEANSTYYHWGPVSLLSVFGGIVIPVGWQLIFHPTGGALASSGHSCDYRGIKLNDAA